MATSKFKFRNIVPAHHFPDVSVAVVTESLIHGFLYTDFGKASNVMSAGVEADFRIE